MINRSELRAAFAGIAVSVIACLTGCSAGGGGKLQDAGMGFTIDYRFSDLPPGCPPVMGNDKGIGAPCTHAGGQCTGGKICACDTNLGLVPPEGTPCFCTIAILQSCDTIPAGTCGQNAMCCSYRGQAAICVPDACLESATCPAF